MFYNKTNSVYLNYIENSFKIPSNVANPRTEGVMCRGEKGKPSEEARRKK